MNHNSTQMIHMDIIIQEKEDKISDLKQAILDYGGVAAGFWADYNCYLSDDTTSYYCPVSDNSHTHAGGHAITIVGWDDNYSRNHFASGCRPSNNGAWIVKNSYGTYFGENGYMYNILDLGYYKEGEIVEVEVQLLENDLKFNSVMFYTFDISRKFSP